MKTNRFDWVFTLCALAGLVLSAHSGYSWYAAVDGIAFGIGFSAVIIRFVVDESS